MKTPVRTIVMVALLLAGAASRASTCEDISAQIDAKIKASGVVGYTLATVDAGAQVAGKVVGSCDLGTRKIVYARSDSAATAPARSRDEPMLTECKDGSVSMGGNCRK
ncbi:hypothetical protein SRS16CHR_00998 [Variovorax sp. SRS16]|uniref:DUF1161 domain-containing protein n=1 Tax=Variovorax sp. SRS16 TaxID=282217 RepID=UPI0013176AC6|nr:DUF1161 domain-containing protein [Variovorax sp. SRS16]VTU14249.1 hypothetical protein SRS16CHR_00998 [Variovorax sp. SRS16]